ncbi:Angio-associated migratory cell protein, partial [Lamellibrachia satsuma]
GHKDSVTCVTFSHDSSLVATGDMSGLVKVWSVEKREEVWSFEVSDLEWLEWHQGAPVLMAGTADGDVWMWKIPSGDCKTFQGHGCACGTGTILPDGKRACTGYEDGTLKVWDLKAGTPLRTVTVQGCHTDTVTCLACHHDNVIVATGSTDGMAKLVNSVSGKVIKSFPARSMNVVCMIIKATFLFVYRQNFIAIGTLDGNLGLWDVSTHVLRHQCKHEAGIVRLWWDTVAPFIYACTLDGVVHLWDSRNGERVAQWFGHTDGILDFKVSK